MTEQEKVRKLAEWMGWHHQDTHKTYWWDRDGNPVMHVKNWNPFTSLDHARMLEDEVERRGLCEEYGNYLTLLVLKDKTMNQPTYTSFAVFDIAHATPAQKAEAVWRMIGGEKYVAPPA